MPRQSAPAMLRRISDLLFVQRRQAGTSLLLKVNESVFNERVLLDPNSIDTAGTTAVTAFEPDDAGSRVVYALSQRGSDVQELKVRDVETGADLDDVIRWVKFASIAWRGDRSSTRVIRRQAPSLPNKHSTSARSGFTGSDGPQSDDTLVYDRPDLPQAVFEVKVTNDGWHLVITSRMGASDDAEVHVIDPGRSEDRPLQVPSQQVSNLANIRPLVTGLTAGWHFIDGEGNHLYSTPTPARRSGRWCGSISPRRCRSRLVIVPEIRRQDRGRRRRKKQPSGVVTARCRQQTGFLVVGWQRSTFNRAPRYRIDCRARWPLARPAVVPDVHVIHHAADADGCRRRHGACGGVRPGRQPRVYPSEPADYVTEQVRYPSKDGTPISMFLVRRRATSGRPEGLRYESRADASGSGPRDIGSAGLPACARPQTERASARLTEAPEARRRQACPVLLSGYGGFNISRTPAFDPGIPVARSRRHLCSRKPARRRRVRRGMAPCRHARRKQNVFDDFIAAAEFLYADGTRRAGRMAIEGGSNGGLLFGAAMMQRPDLLGAVLCRVPVADMLRYHLFTVGRFWIPSTARADDPAQFAYPAAATRRTTTCATASAIRRR